MFENTQIKNNENGATTSFDLLTGRIYDIYDFDGEKTQKLEDVNWEFYGDHKVRDVRTFNTEGYHVNWDTTWTIISDHRIRISIPKIADYELDFIQSNVQSGINGLDNFCVIQTTGRKFKHFGVHNEKQ